jgi:hypothetical protein
MLKVKVRYFELEGRRMLRNDSYGIGESEVCLCYLHDLNSHSVSNKAPKQSEESKRKEQTLSELQLGFASLLQEYEDGTASMVGLASLSGVRLNEWKVMSHLEKR